MFRKFRFKFLMIWSSDSIVSLPLDTNPKPVENDGDFRPSWGTMNEGLPVFDDSIWAEAAMSLDFPQIAAETAIYSSGNNLADVGVWDSLQTPWCM